MPLESEGPAPAIFGTTDDSPLLVSRHHYKFSDFIINFLFSSFRSVAKALVLFDIHQALLRPDRQILLGREHLCSCRPLRLSSRVCLLLRLKLTLRLQLLLRFRLQQHLFHRLGLQLRLRLISLVPHASTFLQLSFLNVDLLANVMQNYQPRRNPTARSFQSLP